MFIELPSWATHSLGRILTSQSPFKHINKKELIIVFNLCPQLLNGTRIVGVGSLIPKIPIKIN